MVNKKLVAAGVVMSIFAGSLVGCGGSSDREMEEIQHKFIF